MSAGDPPQGTTPVKEPAAGWLEGLKLDFATIRTIVLTACVVAVLISVPLVFILKNFVTFDALDSYLKLTDSVRPKILHTISEELESGYSQNFILDEHSAVPTMLFYAADGQRVTLTLDSIPIAGSSVPIKLQLNGCNIPISGASEPLHVYNYPLSDLLNQCRPNEQNLHELRVVLPAGIKGSTVQVKCLILVYERVHEHLKEATEHD